MAKHHSHRGGATDVVGRIVALKLGEALRQSVIVDNRGSAGGNLGAEAEAKSPVDGYTLQMGALAADSSMVTFENGKLRYDIVKDFTALLLVVNLQLPAKSQQELITYGKPAAGAEVVEYLLACQVDMNPRARV